MPRFGWKGLLAAGVVALALLISSLLMRGRTPGPTVPAFSDQPSPAAPTSPPPPAPAGQPPSPEPPVPVDLPTTPPGLDRELAGDYQRALRAQGFRITTLTITDHRATGGVRRANIVYRTAGGGTVAALRPELVRLLSPGANPKLALDQITVRAIGSAGAVIVTVTAAVADLDRWLKAQVTDDEFYASWTVRSPSR